MIKHLRVWETEYKTHPTHNGVVTQGFLIIQLIFITN